MKKIGLIFLLFLISIRDTYATKGCYTYVRNNELSIVRVLKHCMEISEFLASDTKLEMDFLEKVMNPAQSNFDFYQKLSDRNGSWLFISDGFSEQSTTKRTLADELKVKFQKKNIIATDYCPTKGKNLPPSKGGVVRKNINNQDVKSLNTELEGNSFDVIVGRQTICNCEAPFCFGVPENKMVEYLNVLVSKLNSRGMIVLDGGIEGGAGIWDKRLPYWEGVFTELLKKNTNIKIVKLENSADRTSQDPIRKLEGFVIVKGE